MERVSSHESGACVRGCIVIQLKYLEMERTQSQESGEWMKECVQNLYSDKKDFDRSVSLEWISVLMYFLSCSYGHTLCIEWNTPTYFFVFKSFECFFVSSGCLKIDFWTFFFEKPESNVWWKRSTLHIGLVDSIMCVCVCACVLWQQQQNSGERSEEFMCICVGDDNTILCLLSKGQTICFWFRFWLTVDGWRSAALWELSTRTLPVNNV